MAARGVYEVSKMNEHLRSALVDLDLDDPTTILELETIYNKHQRKAAEEAAAEASRKRITAKR
jgi:hypothetical protein